MVNRMVAAGLGVLIGVVGLVGMMRLILGAFGPSVFAVGFVLAAMLPWIVYVTYRARHGRLSRTRALIVLACGVAGLVTVWLSSLGEVLALVLSLVGFGVIWVSDWPAARPATETRFVRIEELTGEDAESAR